MYFNSTIKLPIRVDPKLPIFVNVHRKDGEKRKYGGIVHYNLLDRILLFFREFIRVDAECEDIVVLHILDIEGHQDGQGFAYVLTC